MTEISHKKCKDCNEVKPLDEFYMRPNGKPLSYCKECAKSRTRDRYWADVGAHAERARKGHYRRKYGITVEQFNEMYEAQGGCCAICGTTEPGGYDRFHVDHSHETGEVRALLCHNCNVGVGHFRDNPGLLQAAIEYLEVHNERKLDAS